MTRLLIVGGSGFIGSHLLRRLLDTPHLQVRWGLHAAGLDCPVPDSHEVRRIDLTSPSTMIGIADGVDAVINLGHRISGTAEELRAVNVEGVRHLLQECLGQKVDRFVHLSTAAVYGPGPWEGRDAMMLRAQPSSEVSGTRLAGDLLVLEHGGVVVRPHLVYGAGDRWFLPRALHLLRRVGWVDGGVARHSVIAADLLAEGVLSLAVAEDPHHGVLLAGEGSPTLREFLTEACRSVGQPPPLREVTVEQALAHPDSLHDHRWGHDINLMAEDHYFDANSFLELTRRRP